MDFEDIPLGKDELTPMKPYATERAEEIAELMAEIKSIAAEINGDL